MTSTRPDAGRTRILFYNHTGHTSGAERVLLTTIAGLDRSRFEPIAACPPGGSLETLLHAQGTRTVPVGELQARFTTSPRALLTYLRSFAEVILDFRASVNAIAPDVLHANSVRAGLVASIATLGTGTPLIWHIHDDLPAHPISTLVRLAAFLSPRTIFLAVSHATAEAFRGNLPFAGRITVLYNGIDLGRCPRKATTASSFREELGLGAPGVQEQEFLISAVGMINPRKGLPGLLHAFRLVHDKLPGAHLAIVGAPIFNRDDLHLAALRDQAQRLGIDSRVHFTGSRDDVPLVLRSSDLLVLNAFSEPFGLALVEAMASGTPVLATRVGGVPEFVTDNETGFLVAPGESAALAARILGVIADPVARLRVASAAALEVCPRFSEQRYNAGFAFFLDSRFARRKSPDAPDPALARFPISPTAIHPPLLLSGAASLRVAVFHDNFAQYGGAERVAEELYRTLKSKYPETDLLSTLSAEERLSPYLRSAGILNTWMQHLPARGRLFRAYFLFYPFAVDRVDLSRYDFIVSSCFGYAKGIRRRPGALHVCYCHTPMRWVWRTEDYLSRESNSRIKTALLALPLRWLKAWEVRAALHPDLYIANSVVVAERLFRSFGFHAVVIPPPIDTRRFAPPRDRAIAPSEDFYLVISRLVPYKRFDLAVDACTLTGRRLVVIGDGPDRARLEARAGSSIAFLGRVPDLVVNDYARRCRALIFPGEEDFGITPLEINAAGRPVVAYRGGGAMETILDGFNGLFFDEPTAASLIAAMDRIESRSWDAAAIRGHALTYDSSVFQRRILDFVHQALAERDCAASPTAAPANLPIGA